MDQYQLFLNNGGGVGDNSGNRGRDNNANKNPRNRGKETALPSVAAPMTTLSRRQPQPIPPIPINPTQLHYQQSHGGYSGLCLAYGPSQQHPQLFQQNNFIPPFQTPSSLAEDPSTHTRQRKGEIDQIIQTYGNELRQALSEMQQKHYCALMDAVEESIARRMREKDIEMENETRRRLELEEQVSQLSVQTQVWQAKAREHEANALALTTQIEEAIKRGEGAEERREEEAESHTESAESKNNGKERVGSSMLMSACKVCRRRVATVLILPCRHLCLCNACNAAALESCPVCRFIKSGSVEVYFS